MQKNSKEEQINSDKQSLPKTSKATKSSSKRDTTKNSKKSPSKKTTSTFKTAKASKKPKTSNSTKTTKKISSKKNITSTNPKKSNIKKGASTKNTSKTPTKKKKTTINTMEYYDLPQKYNQTVVKVLAQTPKTLFVYWEISDDDIKKFKKEYGENFFETTKPVLIIHNDSLNYSFEVEINDFANSWYLHVNDSRSDYRIELGRRPFETNKNTKTDYIYITSSNEIESPNDHILFNNSQKMVYFRNVKTKKEIAKPFASLSFMKNMGKIYEIYDLYQELYKNEENIEVLTNPSSHM